MRNARACLGATLALGILALGGWRAWTMGERDLEGRRGTWLLEDQNRMRQLVALIAQRGELPMSEGVLDPYFFVRNGDVRGANINILGSRRIGVGPTEEEALRGDYTNFPWHRYRGERTHAGPPFFPLLWGQVSANGWTLVGFSDGSVRGFEREELAELGLRVEGPG